MHTHYPRRLSLSFLIVQPPPPVEDEDQVPQEVPKPQPISPKT